MRTLVLALALFALALPLSAAVVHDEGSDGDLSSNEAAPTALDFVIGDNGVIGSVSNVAGFDRDYITFTIEANEMLVALNLMAYAPDNLGFAAFNAGTTSFIPSAATNASFLAGIHPAGSMVGTDLMPQFVGSSVTTNALPSASLGPGDYCFMIQQTSPIVTSYSLQFVVQQTVATVDSSWSRVKALFDR